MQYKSITNFPKQRANLTENFVFWENCFNPEELQRIQEMQDRAEKDVAKIMGSDDKNHLSEVRRSEIQWLRPSEETGWIFSRINWLIEQVNERFYGFDLWGYEAIQYTTYKAENQGHYGWHFDSLQGFMHMGGTRKLSLSILVNDDFEGGDFLINTGDQNNAKKARLTAGRAVFFPSYMCHCVTPVTKGVRKSLVVWCVGPKFR